MDPLLQIEDLPLDLLEVTQEFYKGKDGTDIPMFLLRRKGWEKGGPKPVLLYGYGGYAGIAPSSNVQIPRGPSLLAFLLHRIVS